MKKLFLPFVILLIYSEPFLIVAMDKESREVSFVDPESDNSSRSLRVFKQENTTVQDEETFPFAGTAESRDDSSDQNQSLKKWFSAKNIAKGAYWTLGSLTDVGLTIAAEALTIDIAKNELHAEKSAQPVAMVIAGVVCITGFILLYVGDRTLLNRYFKKPTEPADPPAVE